MDCDSPKWLGKMLDLFCPAALREEIEGDLLQRLARDYARYGRHRAKAKLLWNAMKFFRPGIVFRNHFSFRPNGNMITHYISLSLRSLVRHKVFSAINVIGLAVGLAAFFLIVQYVSFETGFDRFHNNHDRVFRIVHQQVKNGEVTNSSAKTFIGLRRLIYENFPDVTATAFSVIPIDLQITYGYRGKTISAPGRMIQADTSFFKVFPGMLLKGDRESALKDPQAIILSEKLAGNTFGESDPVSQLLDDIVDINESPGNTKVVTGVFQDLPPDSHLHFEAIVPIDMAWDTTTFYWDNPSFYTYAVVPQRADLGQIEARLNTLLAQVAKDFPNIEGAQIKLQPVAEIHLQAGIGDEMEVPTDALLPLILSAIAVFILLIAWINYINLEMARFVTQIKEVGIRRVIGSTRKELALQFFIRYGLLNAIALSLSVIGILLIVPYFSDVTGIPIYKLSFGNPEVWISATVFYLAGTSLVGILPAILLLKLNPAAIIKGQVIPGERSGKIRTSLVVVQYVASTSMIVFVIVATQQLNFMKLSDKKLEVGQVVAIENQLAYTDDFGGNGSAFSSLSNLLKTNPAIKEVSCSSNVPGRPINFTLVNEIKRNKQDPYDPRRFKLLFIDYNYISLYGLKLKAGRNYLESEEVEDNTGRIILNEAAIHALGFKSADEAVNQLIYFQLWRFMKPQIEIIGILEDHHHRAIKEEVEPTIYFLNMAKHQQTYYSIKLNKGAGVPEAVSFIEKSYKQLFPKNPFTYFFVEDLYAQQFDSEVHFAGIFGIFSGIALFLACLGIIGITLFEANARLKEISIRKVLGSSINGIIKLLSTRHFRMIIISFVISIPLAFYASSQWLLTYPVHMNITATPFIIAGLSIISVTVLASVFQTIKAATANPVDHLKNE